MQGIGYNDTALLLTRTDSEIGESQVWYTTRLENVRLELTQGENIGSSGLVSADKIKLKIYDAQLPKPYKVAEEWAALSDKTEYLTFSADTYFMISTKSDIGRNVQENFAEVINDSDYVNDDYSGLIDYLSSKYGMTYHLTTSDHYSLIPHWIIGGE